MDLMMSERARLHPLSVCEGQLIKKKTFEWEELTETVSDRG